MMMFICGKARVSLRVVVAVTVVTLAITNSSLRAQSSSTVTGTSSSAATVTMTDTSVIGANARPGLSLGDPNGSNPLLKNYFGYSNPGFEPMIMKQLYQFQGTNSHSSPTSFQWDVNNTEYASYDANQWANATFSVVQGSYASGNSDPALGCTGTVASSTNVSGAGPIFVIKPSTNQGSSGCAGSLGAPGQLIIVSTNNNMSNIYPTPSTTWTSGSGNNGSAFTPSLSGGATISSNTTDLCPTCGTQSLALNIPAAGSVVLSASSQLNTPVEKSITLNGTYTISFWAKSSAATPPQVLVTATPRSGATCSKAFNASSTPITSTWTQFEASCSFTETPGAGGPWPFVLQIKASPVGNAATNLLFDNISMVNNAATNPTVFDDDYVNALKAWCQSATNTTGPACTMRLYAPSPEAETMANWVLPSFQHRPQITNPGAISTAYATNMIGITDFLVLCQYIGAIPVLNIPITITPTDTANLVDYLEGGSSTTYGAIRTNAGQSIPWVGASDSPFPEIYIEFGNENWNSGFLGNAIGWNQSGPTNQLYYDYALRSKTVFAAARAQQSAEGYSKTSTKWVMGLQTATGGDDGALGVAQADVAEINGYTGYDIQNVSTTGCFTTGSTNATCPLFGPALTEPYSNTHDPNSLSGFRQSLTYIQNEKTCGPSGNAACQVMVYEENTGPYASVAGPFTQSVSDSFVQTGVQGVIAAEQMGENDAAGVVNQNEYQALQYYFNEGGVNVHMWGAMIDTGGDCSVTNSATFGGSYCPRPQMLGAQVYNYCKIGPMVQTSWTGVPTYNLPTNSNYVNALSNVPVLHSYAFAQGDQRCMVIVNADVMSSHTVDFSGSHAPTTGVTTYQFAPASLTTSNEAPSLNPTSTIETPMSNVTTPSVDVSSGYTVPAHSVTAFMWTVNGTPTASAPTLSLASGTYASNQSLSISDTTTGAVIYYTTDGSMPTTSSAKYTSPLTVSSSETVNAIAVASGYSNSAVSSATYTVDLTVAQPVFNLAAGTYSTAQSLVITDATSGATIYYTTNGAAPTTSSSVYAGPLTISSSETVSAIAIAKGYTNSAVTSATYSVQVSLPVAATPVFSVASGTYSGAQSVVISDTTSGASIYYTTDGSTPTTSSTLYKTAVNVSSSMTVNAIAAASGFSNSSIGTATYSIQQSSTTTGNPAAVINYSGGFSSSAGLALNGGSTVTGGVLELTDGGAWEERSAWYSTPVAVNLFSVDFGFQILNPNADGFTFTIQGGGTTLLGPGGGSLGYQGITHSVAVKFDLYNNDGEGPNSTGVFTNGASPTIPATDLTSSGVNLHSGDAMHAHISYDGANLQLTITDLKTGAVANEVYPINIPAAVGGNTAYVGFTAGAGSASSIQQILNWTYTPGAPTVAAPVFSPASGTYVTSQSVTVTDVTPNTKIYYTTDGSTPTASSTLYNGPIAVANTTTLRAIAVMTGPTSSSAPVDSASSSATYQVVAAATLINSPNGFTSGEFYLNGVATLSNGNLVLTNGQSMAASSAWYSSVMPLSSFTTDFNFRLTNATGDGFAFVIQNIGSGALGGLGGSLGYGGIKNSVAIKFDLHNNAGEGSDSTGVYTNGSTPTIPATDLTETGVNLHSGDVMHAHIVYNGNGLMVVITDTVTSASVTERYPVNIPSAVGASTGYVGFTAGTGSSTAVQTIQNWTFTSH